MHIYTTVIKLWYSHTYHVHNQVSNNQTRTICEGRLHNWNNVTQLLKAILLHLSTDVGCNKFYIFSDMGLGHICDHILVN